MIPSNNNTSNLNLVKLSPSNKRKSITLKYTGKNSNLGYKSQKHNSLTHKVESQSQKKLVSVTAVTATVLPNRR